MVVLSIGWSAAARFAGIAGANIAEDIDVSVFCLFCVVNTLRTGGVI